MKPSISLLALLALSYQASAQGLSLSESEDRYVLDNGLIQLTLSKQGDALSLIKDRENLVKKLSGVSRDPNKTRSFYLDYHTGVSGGATNFIAASSEVLENSDEQIHLRFDGKSSDHILLEYHYILRPGVSGVYNYVVAKNQHDSVTRLAELRTVYRFDSALMPHLYNGETLATPPSYASLENSEFVQDETWRLSNGDVYSKYDLVNYQRESNLWGVLGEKFGAWVIPASHEYYSGDLLNQELLVHQDAIALNYLTGAHLGSPDLQAPPGWQKIYGPWLVYVNKAVTPQQLIKNAQQRASIEQAKWPYDWLKDTRYEHQRASLKGNVKTKAPVVVTLSNDPNAEFDQQTLGYFYSSKTNAQGNYAIANVVPGDYRLAVYATSGSQTGILYESSVTLKAGSQVKPIELPLSTQTRLWQIGQANRRADEFKFAGEPRNNRWQHETPVSLIYDIGKSNEKEDWYYAQTKPGIWQVNFDLDKVADAKLNIAFAAASNSGMGKATTAPRLLVRLNGKLLKEVHYANDKAIYRSAMQSGRYHAETLDVPAEHLKNQDNQLEFEVLGGAFMYDVISLSR
jgi:rhamnogalacturonan endolyase